VVPGGAVVLGGAVVPGGEVVPGGAVDVGAVDVGAVVVGVVVSSGSPQLLRIKLAARITTNGIRINFFMVSSFDSRFLCTSLYTR
jgi:hypothetical protein